MPLGDDVLGDRVVGVGGGDQHGAVGGGVRQHPEGAADALGQQEPQLLVDAVGEPRVAGESGGGHEVPAPKPWAAPGWLRLTGGATALASASRRGAPDDVDEVGASARATQRGDEERQEHDDEDHAA